jgi:hypothetical protein
MIELLSDSYVGEDLVITRNILVRACAEAIGSYMTQSKSINGAHPTVIDTDCVLELLLNTTL